MEDDRQLEQSFAQTIQKQPAQPDYNTGQFFKGNLRSGQVLDVETSIIILGDVKAGAKVVSKGNVIILGSLKGNVLLSHWIWIRCRSGLQIRSPVLRISQEKKNQRRQRLLSGKTVIFILNH